MLPSWKLASCNQSSALMIDYSSLTMFLTLWYIKYSFLAAADPLIEIVKAWKVGKSIE